MLSLNNVTVRARLAFIGVLAVAGFALLGWFAHQSLSLVSVNGPYYREIIDSKDVIADILPPPEFILESRYLVLEMAEEKQPERLNALISRLRALRQEFNERQTYWSGKLTDARSKQLLLQDAAQPARQFFEEVESKFIPAALSKNEAALKALASGKLKELFDTHRRAIDSLVGHETRRNSEIESRASGVVSARVQMMTLSAVLVCVIVAVLIQMVGRSVTKPLGELRRVASELAQGDISSNVQYRGTDEIGAVSEAFRQLTSHTRDLASAADALARGDLSHSVLPKSDKDILSKNFAQALSALREVLKTFSTVIDAARHGSLNVRGEESTFQGAYRQMVQSLNETMDSLLAPIEESASVLDDMSQRNLTRRMVGEYKGPFIKIKASLNSALDTIQTSLQQVSVAANQVTSAATQIAAGSQSVAQGASEQARSLGRASGNLEQIQSSTRSNAASAEEANRLAEAAKVASGSGVSSMSQMNEAMVSIRDSAQGTASIIRDINEIAFQTNLLALNAAVEAARAGDVGRGFAVVAEEVRSLALRSKEAAKKTESLIQESIRLTANGESLSQQVGKNLEEIAGVVDKVSSIIGEITVSNREQANAIADVSHAVAEVDKVTQQNAASAEQSASAGEQLSSQAAEMAGLVQKFEVDSSSKGQTQLAVREAPFDAALAHRATRVTERQPRPR